ncbi:MAG: heme biosynthesis HemY N-terminal domain-containing protein [Rhodospirillaceae bacterium]
MVKVILYVFGLTIAVAIAVWLANQPGSVTVDWLGWRINTSVAVLFVMIITLLIIGAFLLRAWSVLVGAGRALKESRKDKRLNRALAALAAGFAAVRGEDKASAQKAVRDASAALGEHQAVRLLEEQTALMMGDANRASSEARELLTDPTTELAALRDLTETAKASGDFEGALSQAQRALSRKNPPRWAVKSVLNLQIALARWQEAAATAERKDLESVFSIADVPRLKAAIYTHAAAAALANQDFNLAIKLARQALTADAIHSPAAAVLARALNATGKGKKAAAELEKSWALSPHPSVLAAYIELAPGESALARASRVEALVSGNAEHPESRLATAESSFKAELWGQARSRLEPLLDQTAAAPHRSRAAALMAQVELGENGDTKAATQYLVLALESKPGKNDVQPPASAADLLTPSYSLSP